VPQLNFPVFDGDHHLYETEEAFTRYLPEELKDVFRYITVDGRTKVAIRNKVSDYIPNPTFEVVARPGATMDFYSGNNPEGKSLREIMGKPMRSIPAFRNPADRLALLDELGIDSALMFPTLASLVEVNFLDLPDITQILIHGFNRWLLDEWTFNYKDRIFPTPVVNPSDVEKGIAELEFCLDHGAKVVLMRPGPVAGSPVTRSPFLPEFDPFWARVQEAGVPVALHASDSGYQKYINDWEGRQIEFSAFKPSTFAAAAMGARPISDTIYSAICHGMLIRFPDVRLVSVENGGGWVLPALKTLEGVYKKMPQEFAEHPKDTFLRSVYVNPFWEDSVDTLIDTIGADRVVFGSDYPHPEGLAEPLAWIDELTGRSDDEVRKIMGGNLYDALGLSTRV
jgi:predicted TIM-barrel fold metal-dependent hydrolase